MDTRMEDYVDDVTAGLKDDPELRLDVQTEFLNHLQETAGEDDTEAALKAFGPKEEVARRLVAGNLRRMRMRALVRIALRAVLVPAAVLIALLLGYGGITRAFDLVSALNRLAGTGTEIQLPRLPCWRKPADQRWEALRQIPVIAAGQDAQRCYALWQTTKDPSTSRVLYATYALMLLKDPHGNLPTFERAMRQGMRVDPDNALYHYLLADAYFQRAMEYTETKITEDKQTHRTINRYDYRLTDRNMLEKGIREFRTGLARPALRTYHTEMGRLQFAALPTPRHSEDYLDRIVFAATVLFPELAHYRELGRRFPYAGLVLIKEGRTAEGEALLHAWKPYTEHLLGDRITFLIQYLAAAAIGDLSSETCAQQYDALGRPETARQMRREADDCLRPYRDWRANRSARNDAYDEACRSSVLASMLFPIGGPGAPKIAPKDLAPLRGLDQTWLEIAGASGLLILLTLVMVYVAIVALIYALLGKRPEKRPLLILPAWKDLARILGLGVLLPLLVYVLVTRSGLDGRQYGLGLQPWRFVIFCTELVLLGGALLIVPQVLAKRTLDFRCRALGIAGPRYAMPPALVFTLGTAGILVASGAFLALAGWGTSQLMLPDTISAGVMVVISSTLLVGDGLVIRRLFCRLYRNAATRPPTSPALLFVLGMLGMLLAGLAIFLLLASSLDTMRQWFSDDFALVYFTVLTSALIVGIAFGSIRFARRLFPQKAEIQQPHDPGMPPDTRYPGTMARSLVFIYALVIVLTAALIFPTLDVTERTLLRQDTLLLPRSGEGFSPLETRLTERFRQQLLTSFERHRTGELLPASSPAHSSAG